MFVFVLFALLSLAAAQCGDSCSCGNSACCQNPYASGSPYSVFGLGYGPQYSYRQQCGPGQQYGYIQQCGNGQQYGYIAAQKVSCLKVNPVPVSLEQIVRNQPVFTRVTENNEANRQVDNICATFFPLPDDSTTFLSYYSVVYTDGSNRITSTIISDVGEGTAIRGNAYYSYTQRLFATLGNNLLVGCNTKTYGDSDQVRVYAISLGSVNPLGVSCVQQIQNIIQCVGQSQDEGLYVLPYRLPTRCVTQQVCSLVNPLLDTGASFNTGCSNGRC